jgi:hypothetical protein
MATGCRSSPACSPAAAGYAGEASLHHIKVLSQLLGAKRAVRPAPDAVLSPASREQEEGA